MLYLFNVPQWTTTMPPVALTCLTGFFENRNIPVKQIDLNIKLYNYLFSEEFSHELYNYIGENQKKLLNNTYIDYHKYILTNIQNAVENIRNKKISLDKCKLDWANNLINEYLKIANQYLAPISITLNSMKFGIEDLNEYTKIAEKIEYTKYFKIINIYEKIINDIDIKSNSMIGFSINNFSQLINSIIISKILKKNIKAHYFIGGAYLNANVDTLIKSDIIFKIFDSLCLYDGEHAIENLYEHIYKGKKIRYKNIIFKENIKIYPKEQYFVEDVKQLPPPSYTGLNFEEYLSPIKIISIPISRGCYGSCTFCSYNNLVSSKWREQSIEQIVEEIRQCMVKYKSEYFFFSVATLSPKMAKELSQALIEQKLKIYWASGIRMEKNFNEEVIGLMARSGCVRLDIGLESADQIVLNDMNKKVYVEEFYNIIFNMKKNGILPYLYVIKNFPTEKLKQWEKTINFLNRVKDKILGFSCYEFFLSPNTKIYEEPEKFDIYIEEYEDRSKELVNSIKKFESKISLQEKRNKNYLLNKFYEDNKDKYIKYGSAYIKKDVPLNFPSQMLYITNNKDEKKYDSCKKYRLNAENIILLDKSNGKIELLVLDTLKKVIITEILYNMIKNEGIEILLYMIKKNKNKKLIKIYNMLKEEFIIK